MGQLQVQLLKWADVAKKQSFQQKDDFTRRFLSFQTLVFSCVSNMAASDLLAEVFARFSTCFRIFLADTASYLALRKSSSNPPKKGSTTRLVILWLLLLLNSGEFTNCKER